MVTLDELRYKYLIADTEIGFAEGRRKILRYVLENAYANYTSINRDGPQPFEYLNFAKKNIAAGSKNGAIDGLSNAKRAIHLTMEALFDLLGLGGAYARARFPTKLEVMQLLNAFPTRMIDNLNKKRNLVEHEFQAIELDEVSDFVDVAEMFLLLAHSYLKHTVVGAFVGIEHDDRCLEWAINFRESQLLISEVVGQSFIESPMGRVYYDISIEDEDKQLLHTIKIGKSNREDWLTYLDLFVYLTRRNAAELLESDQRKERIYIHKQGLYSVP